MNRVRIAAVAALCLVLAFNPLVRAEYDTIRSLDVGTKINAQVVLASATHTSTAWTALPKTINQSVQVTGTGLAPNYKVEILVSLDGTTFVKPETGGDLGTFTDQNPHIMAVAVPLSVAHKLKITELSGANSITITALEASQ